MRHTNLMTLGKPGLFALESEHEEELYDYKTD